MITFESGEGERSDGYLLDLLLITCSFTDR
jgi:hypothetical protein